MADQEHLEILLQGKQVWKEWKLQHLDLIVDLTGADLSGADLSSTELTRVDLSHANLSRADLSGAYLSGAKFERANLGAAKLVRTYLPATRFVGADLERADLSGANLEGANFSRANLTGADLSRANLVKAHFIHSILNNVNLAGADLNNSQLGYTQLGNLDLSTAIGLSTVHHYFPSTLGVDTLYRSGGNIPESFLRGCGVPDDFITFIPSHFGIQQAIQFYSCFISYSTKDEEFARRLYSRLRDEHLRVWFAPEDLKGGQKLHEQIEFAIQLHDRLLLVLSEESMQSEWVMTEIRNARRIEIEEKRRKLFPITLINFEAIKKWKCFDGDTGKDLAMEIREYFIPDFSNWKNHDVFEKGFARLLRDLRAEETKQ